jgi:hypothetical protein
MPVIHVLVLAASALPVILTARLDALGRRRDDADEVCGGVPFLYIDDFDFDALAAENKRDEDDETFDASNAIAAERNVGDVELEPLAGLKTGCCHALELI